MVNAEQHGNYREGVRRLEWSVRAFDERVRGLQSTMELVRASRAARGAQLGSSPVTTAPVLTDRELRILRMIADGYDNGQIAEKLNFGLGTIKMHVREILQKLHTSNRTVAAVRAVRAGLI